MSTPNRAIVRDNRDRPATTPLFTVAEANRALVYVQRVVNDIVSRYHELVHLREERDRLTKLSHERDNVQAVRRRIGHCVETLNELHRELTAVGCVLKDWQQGLVDFPAQRGDERVWLCWRLGEATVGYWHPLHSGIAGRQAIDATFDQPANPQSAEETN